MSRGNSWPWARQRHRNSACWAVLKHSFAEKHTTRGIWNIRQPDLPAVPPQRWQAGWFLWPTPKTAEAPFASLLPRADFLDSNPVRTVVFRQCRFRMILLTWCPNIASVTVCETALTSYP